MLGINDGNVMILKDWKLLCSIMNFAMFQGFPFKREEAHFIALSVQSYYDDTSKPLIYIKIRKILLKYKSEINVLNADVKYIHCNAGREFSHMLL